MNLKTDATLDVVTLGEAMAMFVAGERGDLASATRFTVKSSPRPGTCA
mgnify:CR=1 FL=1